jgi:hypothetical protein
MYLWNDQCSKLGQRFDRNTSEALSIDSQEEFLSVGQPVLHMFAGYVAKRHVRSNVTPVTTA